MRAKTKSFIYGGLFVLGIFLILILVINSHQRKPVDLALDSKNTQNKTEFIIGRTDHVRGEANAPLTIVEFSDFECPYCAAFYVNMKKLWQRYPHKIRWVYKQFPLESIHPSARAAAEASECAAEQGKFWEFADSLEGQRENLNSQTFENIARVLFLNMEQFNNCVATRKYQDKVTGDLQLGVESGVEGTPTSFFNGYKVPGVVPLDKLEELVNGYIK